ncbi:MAG: cbb3-type cytochrome c oxidase subunit II [Desulfobulbaceae bacterium]|nr:cbb3-type cytochrome c oxidase subunit II [Desulfobulbaceae bacterium]
MSLYKKPILFALLATVTILVGTVAMVFVPLFMPSTQPHNNLQKPYTALELAGRDVYQAEGCNNCHTQTVRPLKAEVARYGPYSKAWEFEYDRPFLWGSKRTGPDLARAGGKYSDKWHYKHMVKPTKLKFGSNMPEYDFMADIELNPAAIESSMKVLGYPYTQEEIDDLEGMSRLDAIVAYIQKLGTAVERPPRPKMVQEGEKNSLANDSKAIAQGKRIFDMNCTGCHGIDLKGDVGADLTDVIWLGSTKDFEDWEIFEVIADGTVTGFKRRAEGGMPPFGDFMGKYKIWSVIAYMRSMEAEE